MPGWPKPHKCSCSEIDYVLLPEHRDHHHLNLTGSYGITFGMEKHRTPGIFRGGGVTDERAFLVFLLGESIWQAISRHVYSRQKLTNYPTPRTKQKLKGSS